MLSMDVILTWKAFLSTLSLRRATPSVMQEIAQQRISIHALLAESDADHFDTVSALAPISIHALLAESDIPNFRRYVRSDISIHALLAESDRKGSRRCVLSGISIHALLAESDAFWFSVVLKAPEISIHALLAESDFVLNA